MRDFKTLTVWQRSHELALRIVALSRAMPPDLDDLSDWMRTDAITVPAKIANGCGRGNRAGLVQMLRLADASASALGCDVMLAMDLRAISSDECEEIMSEIDSIRRMLSKRIRRASAFRYGHGRILRRRAVPGPPRTDN